MPNIIDPVEWTKIIKMTLGYPVVKLAITDDMIMTCIEQAIREIEPYLTEAELISGSGDQINLKDYNVHVVVRVWRQKNALFSSGSGTYVDEFALINYAGLYGNTSSGYSLAGATPTLGYDFRSSSTQISTLMQGVALRNLFLSELSALVPVDWRFIDNMLYVSGFYGDVVIEAITDKSLNHMTRTQENWVRNFALAKVKQVEGEIRSKVQIEGSPITLNGETLKSEGKEEETALREKLGTEIGLFFAMR